MVFFVAAAAFAAVALTWGATFSTILVADFAGSLFEPARGPLSLPLALVCFGTEAERMKPSEDGGAVGMAPFSLLETFATERLLALGLDSETAFLRTV